MTQIYRSIQRNLWICGFHFHRMVFGDNFLWFSTSAIWTGWVFVVFPSIFFMKCTNLSSYFFLCHLSQALWIQMPIRSMSSQRFKPYRYSFGRFSWSHSSAWLARWWPINSTNFMRNCANLIGIYIRWKCNGCIWCSLRIHSMHRSSRALAISCALVVHSKR